MEGRLASLKLGFVMLMTASLVAACSKGGEGSSGQSSSQNTLSIAAYKAAGPSIAGPLVSMSGGDVAISLSLPDGASYTSASWDFGDGSPVVSGLGPMTHEYTSKGIDTVTVVLVDASGSTLSLTHQINVVGYLDGITCLADLALVVADPATVGVAQPMQVSVPSCLTKYVTSVSWNFGDGTSGTGTSVQHTYTNSGSETITVQVFAPFTSSGPWVTFTQTIDVVAAPTPTPTPAPSATPISATPTPAPTSTPLCALNATRQSFGAEYNKNESCGVDGTKSVTYHDQIVETCSAVNEKLAWIQTSSSPVKISEGACSGQSCSATGGGKVVNGGIVTGVVVGTIQVPLTCAYGEIASDTYSQLADQTCQNGQLVSGSTRQGTLVKAGSCPTYAWIGTSSWSQCSANCGGTQTQSFECHDSAGVVAPAVRCNLAMPNVVQVCDGNAEAASRSDVATTTQSAGNTSLCPANQIGVTVAKRDVTTTTVYACIDHQIQQASQTIVNGAWVTESYCRTYTAYRCSQDSLSNTDAKGRYQWMLKCSDQIPVVKQFLNEFATVTLKRSRQR